MRAEYPPGYQPKRDSNLMIAMPHLKGEIDALHAYRACATMGTLTGAPKVRAAQILRGIECDARGPYGGAVGYVNAAGEMDTAIVIRSALVQDGVATVRAGAGIVADSSPANEYAETLKKAGAMFKAIERVKEYDGAN